MLAQLSTVKARLGLDDLTTNDDALLTAAIGWVSARFDLECGRNLERMSGITNEFDGDQTELRLRCFPIESVAKFELKETEAQGWVEVSGVDFILRYGCVVVLREALGTWTDALRVTYTGGYVPPGASVGPGQTPLPADLAMSAVEQVACWYMNRDRLGVVRLWPKGGTYQQFSELDLLPSVRAVLCTYQMIAT
jgi:hypothetical protein